MWHISLKTIEKESVNEMIVAIAKIDSIYEHSTFLLPNQRALLRAREGATQRYVGIFTK